MVKTIEFQKGIGVNKKIFYMCYFGWSDPMIFHEMYIHVPYLSSTTITTKVLIIRYIEEVEYNGNNFYKVHIVDGVRHISCRIDISQMNLVK